MVMLLPIIAYFSRHKMALLMLLDALLLPLAMVSAIVLRLGGSWDTKLNPYWWFFIIIPLCVIPIFVKLGLYRAVLKYFDDKIIYTVLLGVTLTVLVLAAVILMLRIDPLPRSSLVIYWVFAMAYIGGSRFFLRGIIRRIDTANVRPDPIIIYGAGRAGIQLMLALQAGREYRTVAFVDDDPLLWRKTLRGVTIYSPLELPWLIKQHTVSAILIALPSVSRVRQQEILVSLESLRIPIKRLPSMAGLVSGEVRVEELKEVDIEDLLGRDPVPPQPDLMSANIFNRVVMVSGAGGSIGSELVRHVARYQPKLLILFELSEYALYVIERELAESFPAINRVALLGSVTDRNYLAYIFQHYKVETIYHAAAYKHVPIVEYNPLAGVYNNVFGTDITAQVAEECHVSTFVLISTDKAVRPTNMMGASKRLAELCLQSRDARGSVTRFIIVRFGNVLGSSGSVIPLFKLQIKRGGPVTITHPDVTRYFMTLPEAAQLVIQAGAMGKGGDVFVLDMGNPIRIVDLARRMIHLSGLKVREPGSLEGDIEICFTGLRPGEKLYEELLIGDKVHATSHRRIWRAQESFLPATQLNPLLERLQQSCLALDVQQAYSLVQNIVPEFSGSPLNNAGSGE